MKQSLLLILILLLGGCYDLCENTVILEEKNQENGMKAVVFDRNCGATTSLSRQVSILKEEKELPNDAGNIFTSSHYSDVQIRWVDSTHLEITRIGTGKDFLMEESLQGIKISYALNE
ncbi:MAG: hypothetical protein AAF546_14555 [Verrucomicrobiota bacterium]